MVSLSTLSAAVPALGAALAQVSPPSYPQTDVAKTFSAIATLPAGEHAILGTCMAQRGEVDGLLSLALKPATKADATLLAAIDRMVLSRTYVAGHNLTLADYALFMKVETAASQLPAPAKKRMSSLMRWCRQMHPLCKGGVPAGPEFGTGAALASCLSAMPPVSYHGIGSAEVTPTAGATAEATPATRGDNGAGEAKSEGQQKKRNEAKKERKAAKKASGKAKAGKKPKKGPTQGAPIDFSKMEIKVGKVVDCRKHDNSDKLLVEKINLGEGEPRTICSGLAAFIKPEEMTGKLVLVVTNLKPAKMGGVPSEGMVLCACSDDHSKVEVIDAPATAKIGERVVVDGFEGEPASAGWMGKKKVLDKMKPGMRTNGNREPCYEGKPFMTSAGPCTVPTLTNAAVS